MSKKGVLYVVATPIGNMEDITLRALTILKSVAFVLAEDTRYTKKLLDRYEISKSLVSYRDQNHKKMVDKVIEKLDMGLDLALVSDSGTPLISDPGYKLVSSLRDAGYSVKTVPGPSALTASLSISGLPTDRVLFLGFLPKSVGKRRKALALSDSSEATLVIYESPKRLMGLLELIKEELGGKRRVWVGAELTKVYERHYYGEVSEVLSELREEDNVRGEYVVCVSKS